MYKVVIQHDVRFVGDLCASQVVSGIYKSHYSEGLVHENN